MDIVRALELCVQLAIIVLLLYAWMVAMPEQNKLFKECEEKTLCANDILKGEVCEKYEATKYNISGAIGNISQSKTE